MSFIIPLTIKVFYLISLRSFNLLIKVPYSIFFFLFHVLEASFQTEMDLCVLWIEFAHSPSLSSLTSSQIREDLTRGKPSISIFTRWHLPNDCRCWHVTIDASDGRPLQRICGFSFKSCRNKLTYIIDIFSIIKD